MNYQLDLSQYQCPLPLLMSQKALAKLPSDSLLTIILNGSSAVQDFQILCQQQNYHFISWQKLTALEQQILIQKP